MKYYVYAHMNPLTKQPFYIGKGTRERCFDRSGRNGAWKGYVSYLKAEGLTYGVDILHVCQDEEEALDREREEVQKLLDAGKEVMNQVHSFTSRTVLVDDPVTIMADPLARFVRSKRKEIGLTQRELAERAGVGLRLMREIEGGQKDTFQMRAVNQVLAMFGYTLGPVHKLRTGRKNERRQ